MALKLSDLKSKTKTVTVTYDDVSFEITYRLDFYTAQVEALLAELTSEDNTKPLSANINILSEIICDWDIVDDDGNPIKPTSEIFKSLGSNAISAIMNTIMSESNPNPQMSS